MLKKIFGKLRVIIIMVLCLLTFAFTLYIYINKKVKNTEYGVAVQAKDIEFDNNKVGKYHETTSDFYLVYGRFIKIDQKQKWISLLGSESQIWKVKYDSDVQFMYQYPFYDAETKGTSIFTFRYFNMERFTSDAKIGKIILVSCDDIFCKNATSISFIDYDDKYAKYRK